MLFWSLLTFRIVIIDLANILVLPTLHSLLASMYLIAPVIHRAFYRMLVLTKISHGMSSWTHLLKQLLWRIFRLVLFDSHLVSLVCDSSFIAWLPVTQSSNDIDAYPQCIDMDFHAPSINTHTGIIDMYHNGKAVPRYSISHQ